MLWVLGAIALLAWVVGLAAKVTVGAIHLLLVLAIVLFIVGFVQGRRGGARAVP